MHLLTHIGVHAHTHAHIHTRGGEGQRQRHTQLEIAWLSAGSVLRAWYMMVWMPPDQGKALDLVSPAALEGSLEGL